MKKIVEHVVTTYTVEDIPGDYVPVYASVEAYNLTEEYHMGGNEKPYLTWETTATLPQLKKFLEREYGTCTENVETEIDGRLYSTGWDFIATVRYEDTREPYERLVTVTLYTKNEDGSFSALVVD